MWPDGSDTLFVGCYNLEDSTCTCGLNTPNSVIIPPVISSPGVTSNAGFQQLIPEK
jgi:hypothetical protein